MSYITDRRHLASVTNDLMAAIVDLDELWRHEDAAACAPKGAGDGPSSPGPSDPTASIASADRKFQHRDRIGGLLLHLLTRMREELERNRPRSVAGNCMCCDVEPATHGKMCWACDKYLRSNGYRCDPEIHADRPSIRWCGCPSWCCEQDVDGHTSCPDRAADGRTVSERCKKRMQRGAEVA